MEQEFHLDYVMTNMSYTHEWRICGWVYLQKFPNEKLYVGQSINIWNRFKSYTRHKGSNIHHTRALTKYGWKNVKKIVVEIPKFLLNRIESFLIEYYDLMNPKRGYNKTSGGRSGFFVSQETRRKLSLLVAGEKHPAYGKPGTMLNKTHSLESKLLISQATSGENNPMFGKTHSRESRKKMSAALVDKMIGNKHPRYGKANSREATEKNRQAHIGKTHSNETKELMRRNNTGGNNPRSKPVSAFGIIFSCGRDASDYWRAEKAPNNKTNFINKWKNSKKYPDVFEL